MHGHGGLVSEKPLCAFANLPSLAAMLGSSLS
jgi:hypothetical protein